MGSLLVVPKATSFWSPHTLPAGLTLDLERLLAGHLSTRHLLSHCVDSELRLQSRLSQSLPDYYLWLVPLPLTYSFMCYFLSRL